MEDLISSAGLTAMSGSAAEKRAIDGVTILAEVFGEGFESDWRVTGRGPKFAFARANCEECCLFVGDRRAALMWACRNNLIHREELLLRMNWWGLNDEEWMVYSLACSPGLVP